MPEHPETYRENWMPGDTKWHPSVLADVEHYINSNTEPTLKGLAKYLGVSRQCIYNWTFRHETFKLLIMDLKCKAIYNMPMWGSEKTNAKNFKEL